MRTAQLTRKTNETEIRLQLNLDGDGLYQIKSGCGFLDHMLELFARHGRFDITLACHGDLHVDGHHTTEDIGITLGQAFHEALGDKKGLTRYGSCILPMDETLMLVALDLSGRSYLAYDVELPQHKVGDFDTELVQEFLLALSRNLQATIHVKQLAGYNTHHIIEAIFKALARALKQAVIIDPAHADEIPSTKGTL